LIGFEKSVDGTPVAYGDSVYIRKHNLSWNRKLFDTDLIRSREYLLKKLSQGNVTYAVTNDFAPFLLNSYNHVDDLGHGVKCYAAKETIDSGLELYLFGGPDYKNLNRVAQYFTESGLLTLYFDFFRFLRFVPEMRDIERVAYVESLPVPFCLQEWRILSTFVGWAVLVGFSGVIFCMEWIIQYNLRYFSEDIVIYRSTYFLQRVYRRLTSILALA